MKMKLLITMALVQIASITVAMDNKDFSNELPSKYVGFETDDFMFGVENGFGDFNEMAIPSFGVHVPSKPVDLGVDDFMFGEYLDDIMDLNEIVTSSLNDSSNQISNKKSQPNELTQQLLEKSVENKVIQPALSSAYGMQGDDWDNEFNKIKTPARNKRKREGDNEWICEECSQAFSKKSRLIVHVTSHNRDPKEFPYRCALCNIRFKKLEDLKGHQTRKHQFNAKTSFSCDYCTATFAHEGHLIEHEEMHNRNADEYPYECVPCKMLFKTLAWLKTHYKKKHPSDEKLLVCLNDEASKLFTCDHCGATFDRKKVFIKHEQLHNRDPKEFPYECVPCAMRFAKEGDLKKHQTRRHPDGVQLQLFTCGYCPKTFMHKSHLKDHEKLHNRNADEFPHECVSCKIRFKTAQGCDQHKMLGHKSSVIA